MTPVFPSLRDAALDAASVLMPVSCAGCGADDRALCRDCARALVPVGYQQTLAGGLEVLSALRYEGPVRSIILNFKEEGRTDIALHLSRPFAAVIAAAVSRSRAEGPVELVSVPRGRSSYRRRGYDPVTLLAQQARLPSLANALANASTRSQQKTLSRGDRAANAVNSLRAKGPVEGRRFLLIDDVVTTGSTLIEACRALGDAGAEVIGAATLAVTTRHTGVL